MSLPKMENFNIYEETSFDQTMEEKTFVANATPAPKHASGTILHIAS
jgi:hypothetical protein